MSERKTAEAPKYANWVVVHVDGEYKRLGVFYFHYKRDASKLGDALVPELRTGSVYMLPIKEWKEEEK